MKNVTKHVTHNPIRLFGITLLALVFVMMLGSCGKKCKNENPRARVTNNGTKVASVQIKTTGGNTENVNNVNPGTSSEYRSYAPGDVIFTIVVDKVTVADTVQVAYCFDYNIIVDANNKITTVATDRNE